MSDAHPNRPMLAVASIGHHHSGKTSLTCKITEVLARRSQGLVKAVTTEQLQRRGGWWGEWHGDIHDREDGWLETRTISASEVRYATERREFLHVDSPGWRPWLKNAARAQALADALVLVVSAPDGVQPQTHEHLLLARALGHTQVVVFLNKCDLVAEVDWLDLVEQDVRELLIRCGFDGDGTRIIRGAAAPKGSSEAWDASIGDLVEALEFEVKIPEREVHGAPLLYIDRVYSRYRGANLIVTGRLRRGTIGPGDAVWCVGFGEPIPLHVMELEIDHRKAERGQAGELVGLRVSRPGSLLGANDLRSGCALVGPETRAARRLTARLDLLATDEGGRRTPVRSGHVGLLLFGTAVVAGRIEVLTQESIAPGAGATVAIELLHPVYLEPGMTFLLRDGNQSTWRKGQPALWAGSSGMGRVIAVEP